MKQFPDKFFDVGVADPPYGIGADNPSLKKKDIRQKNGSFLKVNQKKYSAKSWDNAIPSPEFFTELNRVCKNVIVFGANYYGLKGGAIVWDKLNGESDQFGCEIAYQSFDNRTDIVYYMWRGMMQGAYCGPDISKALKQQGNKALNERRYHPTQKPVALYGYLLGTYVPARLKTSLSELQEQNFRVYDPTLGSGSSRIAANRLNLDFWGCDNDQEMFEIQEDRYGVETDGVLPFM